ncbi:MULTISPECIES: acyl-CoA dehydrogenase family protein [Saccharothrix]|uniref:acyl-CoA dehydrogenase family protein n=1 Tax=Saccharothrix TaxID=2071 RepID=UPI0009392944|nr:acyl-CoA dehydrogenase family protein [Saccharothrix sp. CB00851]OKI31495.1 acyl-CoA dehydrogenase [Saccharothrix sp. CB00851]
MSTDVSPEAMLEAVREMIPTLRQNGAEADRNRWLPDENIALQDKAGVFRMGVPARFGGLAYSAADMVKVISEISRGDGATGWVTMVWVHTAWTVRLFPDKAQEDVFAGGSVRVSGTIPPTGTITRTDGGYVISGKWNFNTGVRGADWNLVNALLEEPDGTQSTMMTLIPVSELTILDDWDVTGAAATGSTTSVAENVFVPEHRVVKYEDVLAGTVEGRSDDGSDGRAYGLMSLVMAIISGIFTGMARGAYEEFLNRVPGRGITYTPWTDQSEHPLTQMQAAIAKNKIDAAEAFSAAWLKVIQDRADAREELTTDEKAIVRGQTMFAAQLAKEAVELLFSAGGGSVIRNDVPLGRFRRDIEALSLHALIQFNANMELQGRVLLGKEPGTPYI